MSAFELGFLPSVVGRAVVNYAIIDLVEEHAAGDAKLVAACRFARGAIAVGDPESKAAYQRLVGDLKRFAPQSTPPPMPEPRNFELWMRQVLAAGRAAAPRQVAELDAGVAAGELYFDAWAVHNLIYLRAAAPKNAFLLEQTTRIARELEAAAQRLGAALDALGDHVRAPRDAIRSLVARAPSVHITNSTTYYSWVQQLDRQLSALRRALDVPVVEHATGQPTAQERALLEQIVAHPDDDAPRVRFAELAARRKDPRAELVTEQMLLRDLRRGGPMTASESKHMQRVAQLVQQNPEWSQPLLDLGVRAVRFRRGFADEISIDAARFLSSALQLYNIAPILHVRFLAAKGHVAALAGSAHLARLHSIGFAENGLTDDDARELAGSRQLGKLVWLDLTRNHITNAGVELLAASSALRAVKYLALAGNPARDPIDDRKSVDDNQMIWTPSARGKELEAKVGHSIEWLHPSSERWPPDPDSL